MDVPDADSLIPSPELSVNKSTKPIVIFSNGKSVSNVPMDSTPFQNTNSGLLTPHAVSFEFYFTNQTMRFKWLTGQLYAPGDLGNLIRYSDLVIRINHAKYIFSRRIWGSCCRLWMWPTCRLRPCIFHSKCWFPQLPCQPMPKSPYSNSRRMLQTLQRALWYDQSNGILLWK